MKVYTLNDIRALKPCYDPANHLPQNWMGTIEDIFNVETCPAKDRLWVAIGLVEKEDNGPRINRLFAVKCARREFAHVLFPDPRSVTACDVAERFANGDATPDELSAAGSAAFSAHAARYDNYPWFAARACTTSSEAAARVIIFLSPNDVGKDQLIDYLEIYKANA